MPRAGLDQATVIAAAADLADEVGLPNVTMALLATRLGVRAPSLYKHVSSQAEIHRRIAVLALTELGDDLRDALQGRSGRDALTAAAQAIRSYVVEHPGRYAATMRLNAQSPDDPVAVAGARVLDSLRAVLAGYPVDRADTVHAMRMMRSVFHGFAVIEAGGGFEMDTDVDESFTWLITFIDHGLSNKPGISDRDGISDKSEIPSRETGTSGSGRVPA
ncbi:TetR family transcriptional regulator [Actinoplanes sp. OR16]|uniref:TetR/AcrR family transcriptional regulator n=1 Tax=Actinoplanes sp. OR16 TaxID=946334 RepID=UPI000F6F663E|nr:TetR/AcrR family transcriptional regulator [Actinoplanes sp. OR16]BBH71600.1 TetR family transcriptional regulator [Actinoplanes sp. OR16]